MAGPDEPISAATFLSNEGINADLAFGAGQGGQITGYSNVNLDLSELETLGLSQIRTFMTDAGSLLPNGAAPAAYDTTGSASLATYETLAAAGEKFDFIIANGPMTAAQVQGYVDLISQLEAADPGSVIGVEGVNESNNNPAITYTDASGTTTSGDAAALAMQQAIYADVKAASNLGNVPVVDYTTDSTFGSVLNPNPATTADTASVANFHEYADQGYPGTPGSQIPYIAEVPYAVDQSVAGAAQTWVTEWGYPLYPGNPAGVTEQVAGAYILDTIIDYAQSGTKNFLYGLNEDTNYFGLYYSNGALTTEGQDLANLNAIVSNTAGLTTPTINATADLSALTDGNMLQVGNDLIVWAEPELINQTTGASAYPLPSPTEVTIQLGGIYDVSEYDPLSGTTAMSTAYGVSSIAVGVSASPIILELTPLADVGLATSTATTNPSNASVACYAAGTLILTADGEVAVEALAINDILITASGELRPIKWIGRRSYGGRFLAANPNVQPVRFCAGSLGDGLPSRELLVSPEHAIFLDAVLIPARNLVNGSTIARERRLDSIAYYHVELESHDIIVAEGTPSETFLDEGNRGTFHNCADHPASHYGHTASGGFCAPRVESGYQLEAIRQKLAALATRVSMSAA